MKYYSLAGAPAPELGAVLTVVPAKIAAEDLLALDAHPAMSDSTEQRLKLCYPSGVTPAPTRAFLRSLMDLCDVFSKSWAAVEGANLPEIVQPIAFAKAVDVMTGGQGGDGPLVRDGQPASDADERVGQNPLTLIAEGLGVGPELVSDLFDADDQRVELLVPRAQLPKADAAATKQIALLVAVGRQLSRLDQGWTPVSAIREVCREFGRLDSRNFSATILEMDREFVVRGLGQSREVRVTRAGIEKARELVVNLSNGGMS